jgi:hypothetical protein
VVGVHWGSYTRGVRLALVASRAPLGLLTNKLIIDPATARTDWQVIENVVLFGASTVLTNIVGILTNFNFVSLKCRSTSVEFGPQVIE